MVLKFDKSNAPYVLTKPLHHSQEVVETYQNGSVTVTLQVHLNFELERLILGFGETVEVLAPKMLRNRIKKKIKSAAAIYIQS